MADNKSIDTSTALGSFVAGDQANLSAGLNALWDPNKAFDAKGFFNNPMNTAVTGAAAGAGLGGLLSGGMAWANDKKHENKSERRSRILRQALLGSALGGTLGLAPGAVQYLTGSGRLDGDIALDEVAKLKALGTPDETSVGNVTSNINPVKHLEDRGLDVNSITPWDQKGPESFGGAGPWDYLSDENVMAGSGLLGLHSAYKNFNKPMAQAPMAHNAKVFRAGIEQLANTMPTNAASNRGGIGTATGDNLRQRVLASNPNVPGSEQLKSMRQNFGAFARDFAINPASGSAAQNAKDLIRNMNQANGTTMHSQQLRNTLAALGKGGLSSSQISTIMANANRSTPTSAIGKSLQRVRDTIGRQTARPGFAGAGPGRIAGVGAYAKRGLGRYALPASWLAGPVLANRQINPGMEEGRQLRKKMEDIAKEFKGPDGKLLDRKELLGGNSPTLDRLRKIHGAPMIDNVQSWLRQLIQTDPEAFNDLGF